MNVPAQAVGVTAETDVQWMLKRLVPTPLRHFTDPVPPAGAREVDLASAYIRRLLFRHAGFDRHAAMARSTPNWRYREMAAPHLPPITNPRELAEILVELAERRG